MKRIAIYHSQQWNELVAQGWVTMYVETIAAERIAVMTYCPPRRYW